MLTSSNSTSSSSSSTTSTSSQKSKAQAPKKMLLDLSYILQASRGQNEWERIENNINDWLDDHNIFMVDPRQKQMEFFQSAKNLAFEECVKEDLRPALSCGNYSLSPLITISPQRTDLKREPAKNSMIERRSRFSFSNVI